MEKYIKFILILLAVTVTVTVTDKNISGSANHIIVKEIKLSGINLTENGIYIDTMTMISTEYLNSTEKNSTEKQADDNLESGKLLRMISRDGWIAQEPQNVLTDLELPSTRVVIAHTSTEGCMTEAQCTFRVRFIQTFHIESRNWDDIGYNFLVGGDGAVYEGRGWDKQGAHTKGYNVKSIGIAFIGTFNKIKPTDGQLDAAKLLMQEGVKLGKLTKDYKLYGHRQLIPTESPGDVLYEIIKKWPNFSTYT